MFLLISRTLRPDHICKVKVAVPSGKIIAVSCHQINVISWQRLEVTVKAAKSLTFGSLTSMLGLALKMVVAAGKFEPICWNIIQLETKTFIAIVLNLLLTYQGLITLTIIY